MDDLVCRAPLNYTPIEPLVCQAPPEPPVCEAPPAPPPKTDAFQTHSTKGKSSSSYSFIESSQLTCQAPESISRPKRHKPAQNPANLMCIAEEKQTHIDATVFSSTLDNSKLVADLQMTLVDQNGFNQLSQNDLSGAITSGKISVNRNLFDGALKGLKGTTKSNPAEKTTTTVKDVAFNSQDNSYVVSLKVEKKLWKVPIWDNFEVKFKVNPQGQLVAELDNNWFPNKKILDQLERSVRDAIKQKVPAEYQQIKLETKHHDNQLVLVPQVADLEVPISGNASVKLQHIDGDKAKFEIDKSGHLHIHLKDVKVQGSSGSAPLTPATGAPDQAKVQMKLGLGQDNSRQIYAKGELNIHLDEAEAKKVKVGHETLSDYVQSGTIKNDFSLHIQQKPGEKPQIQNQNFVAIKKARLGGQEVDLETSLKLDFDPQNGIKLDFMEPDLAPLDLNPTHNGVEFMVNGTEYFPKMKKMMAEARDSIDLETYMLHDDPAGQEIAYILARRAAGLDASAGKGLAAHSPDGVKVRFIFNSWKGSLTQGAESEEVMKKARERVLKDIEQSALKPEAKDKTKKQLAQNLQWKFFTEGVLRSDHRKVLVVDGSQATVGGMNLSDKYLSENAYHDVMVKVAGPEVRNIHKEFIENWHEFNHLPPPTAEEWEQSLKTDAELSQSLKTLRQKGQYQSHSKVGTLVTDDHQNDIEKGILKIIDEAHSEINIQQVFFYDQKINKHLQEAMQRGVKINVIISKTPMIDMFASANLLSVYELAKLQKAGAKGQVKLFYYDNPKGGDNRLIHTKAISVDAKKAIVGSANMIGRSLSSPFQRRDATGQNTQTLYNKELSLYLEGREFVREINERLFYNDMVNNTEELDVTAIEAQVKAAGGEAKLREKAALAPLT